MLSIRALRLLSCTKSHNVRRSVLTSSVSVNGPRTSLLNQSRRLGIQNHWKYYSDNAPKSPVTSDPESNEIDYSDPRFAEAQGIAEEAENIISRMTLSQDAAEVNELALEAQRLLQKAMAAGGPEYKSKYVYYAMGVACFKRREYEDAIRWHQKAIQIDAEFVPALLCLAEALQTQRNWGEAIGTYDQAFKHFVSYYARAGSETARKNLNSEELLAEIVVKRGMCYMELPDLDQAESQFKSILMLDNQWATEAYVFLAKLQQARGNWPSSVELVNKALKRDPKHIDAYLTRNTAHIALGKEDLALHDKKMALLLRRERLWTRQSVVMDGANVVKK